MRRIAVIAALVSAAVLVPVVVWAASGRLNGEAERQAAKWTTEDAATSATAWRNVPGLRRVQICALRLVTATLTVRISGAPAAFRVFVDTPEAPMLPGAARFVPQGAETFSATFVREVFPFEADDTHYFTVQWRSPSGERVSLDRGVLHLLFKRGTQGCP